jgi:hypothetical protein
VITPTTANKKVIEDKKAPTGWLDLMGYLVNSGADWKDCFINTADSIWRIY